MLITQLQKPVPDDLRRITVACNPDILILPQNSLKNQLHDAVNSLSVKPSLGAQIVVVDDLGNGLFPSREEALDWIEKNRRPSILESLISAVRDRLFGAQVYYPNGQTQ